MRVNSLLKISDGLSFSVVGLGLRVTDKYIAASNTLFLRVTAGELVKVIVCVTEQETSLTMFNLVVSCGELTDVEVTYDKTHLGLYNSTLSVCGDVKSLTLKSTADSKPWDMLVDVARGCLIYPDVPGHKNRVTLLREQPEPDVGASVSLSRMSLTSSQEVYSVFCNSMAGRLETPDRGPTTGYSITPLCDGLLSQHLVSLAPSYPLTNVTAEEKVIGSRRVPGQGMHDVDDSDIVEFYDTAWVGVDELFGAGVDNLLGMKRLPTHCEGVVHPGTTHLVGTESQNYSALPRNTTVRTLKLLKETGDGS